MNRQLIAYACLLTFAIANTVTPPTSKHRGSGRNTQVQELILSQFQSGPKGTPKGTAGGGSRNHINTLEKGVA